MISFNNEHAKVHSHCILFSIFLLVHEYNFYKYYDMLDQMKILLSTSFGKQHHLINEAYNITQIKKQ